MVENGEKPGDGSRSYGESLYDSLQRAEREEKERKAREKERKAREKAWKDRQIALGQYHAPPKKIPVRNKRGRKPLPGQGDLFGNHEDVYEGDH